jgi:hypothetical protein
VTICIRPEKLITGTRRKVSADWRAGVKERHSIYPDLLTL